MILIKQITPNFALKSANPKYNFFILLQCWWLLFALCLHFNAIVDPIVFGANEATIMFDLNCYGLIFVPLFALGVCYWKGKITDVKQIKYMLEYSSGKPEAIRAQS